MNIGARGAIIFMRTKTNSVDILLEDIPTVPTLIVGFWGGYLRQNCCKIIKMLQVSFELNRMDFYESAQNSF